MPTFPEVRLRQAGLSSARITALRTEYDASTPARQQTLRRIMVSATDETLRRTYGDGTDDVSAAIAAAHDTDAEREAYIPTRLSDAALRASLARKDYDVIVVGAGEVGLLAAVAAARQGMSVLMVADSNRIGGISGWGITVTDVLSWTSPAMIGGLARELFGRIVAREILAGNGHFDRWHRLGGQARPSWYQRAFAEMMASTSVAMLPNAEVTAVSKTGTTIDGATINGDQYTARVWIDATPTGDLVQRAGLSRSIGREAAATYGETGPNIGVRTADTLGVNPYKTPGDPASGLLYGIDPAPLGAVGSGDGRVMTFGWRLFLTSVTAEKAPWPAPAPYDPARYELLARIWASNPTFYNDATNALVRTFQVYAHTALGGSAPTGGDPYKFIDLNSLGYVSSNYPNAAECLEYVTANRARRQQIEGNARQWLLGLIHFILNGADPRIPANLRTQLAVYAPSNRELKTTGGISPQFYVREGCRLVGDYVMTKPDAVVANGRTDWIAWGVYNFDGHPVRALVDNGVAATEGSFDVLATPAEAGFPIPYAVLLPKAAECGNLLCPGQPSVSRYVHTAVRAIPVIVQLGEAAGYAAAVAARQGSTVQAVDVQRVQKMQDLQRVAGADAIGLADAGQILGEYQSCVRAELGAGAAFATVSGANTRWGWLGTRASNVKAVAGGTDRQVRYRPQLYRSGRYRIFLWYPPAQSSEAAGVKRATNVPVTIVHADGTTVRTVNQTYPGGDGGGWDDLGEFYFVKGNPSTHYVELNAATADGLVVDSGIKFVLVP